MKKSISLNRHIEIGNELKKIRLYVMDLRHELATAYGKTKRPCRDAGRVYWAIDSLRNEMDNQFSRDCPSEFTTKAYYGDALFNPLNPSHHAEPRFGGDSVDGVVGSLNKNKEE